MLANPTDTSQSDEAELVSAIDTVDIDMIDAKENVRSNFFMVIFC